MIENDFKEYLRTGAKPDNHSAEGGYIVPDTISISTPGIMGWIYRLFKDKRGWTEYKFIDVITNLIELDGNKKYALVFHRKLSSEEKKYVVERLKVFEKSDSMFIVLDDEVELVEL